MSGHAVAVTIKVARQRHGVRVQVVLSTITQSEIWDKVNPMLKTSAAGFITGTRFGDTASWKLRLELMLRWPLATS